MQACAANTHGKVVARAGPSPGWRTKFDTGAMFVEEEEEEWRSCSSTPTRQDHKATWQLNCQGGHPEGRAEGTVKAQPCSPVKTHSAKEVAWRCCQARTFPRRKSWC